MNNQGESLSFLDLISIISFVISIMSLTSSENISRGQVQQIISEATEDIHQHLEVQDSKIEEILLQLKGDNLDDKK